MLSLEVRFDFPMRSAILTSSMFTLILLSALVFVSASCATAAPARIRVPGEQEKVYVSVFVDETKKGEVGLALTEAVQIEIWSRDRTALALSFEQNTLAVDGTVLSLLELDATQGHRELRLRMKASLVDKAGARVTTLKTAESRATFKVASDDGNLTAERRGHALQKCIRDMARHIVTAIDSAAIDSATIDAAAANNETG